MSEFLNPPFIIAILIALTVHEWAHALVADRLGDPTPRSEGRLTLNPIAHLDPLGTLMFFLVHFGWGKPVPISPRYFKHPKRDSALTAVAGPVSNLFLAILSFILIIFITPDSLSVGSASELLGSQGFGVRVSAFFGEVLANSLFINLALMAFNLLPIAPLDGSKILLPFVPLRYEDDYENFMNYGPMILIGLLIAERLLNFPLLAFWMESIITAMLNLFLAFS